MTFITDRFGFKNDDFSRVIGRSAGITLILNAVPPDDHWLKHFWHVTYDVNILYLLLPVASSARQ